MDQDLINMINQIQIIKQDLYKKHRPELIDGTHALSEPLSSNVTEEIDIRSREYDKLMRHQRKLIYKKDIVAQEKAAVAMQHLADQQREEDLKRKLPSRTNFKSFKDEPKDQLIELQKPWNKLSNNLKIQAVLKFIETLSPKLTDDQTNQLRYLLISSVSQRKLLKTTDVNYDMDKGQINKINKLIFEEGLFKLVDKDDVPNCIGITSFDIQATPVVPNESSQKLKIKKIVLLKKV